MNKLSNDIISLAEIASSIAMDDLQHVEKKIKKYKINKYSPLKLYEGILQSYLFCGFPAAIESLKIFRKYFKEFNITGTKYNVTEFRQKGNFNCKLIYKKNYKKLIENMNSFSPDLKNWMIIEGYGKVMGRKGLSLLEREFMNISILCTKYYENQLHSHLKGCLYLGASKDDLNYLFNRIRVSKNKLNINKGINLMSRIV
ncbi:MAG: hypothetical protein IPL53_07665 [Ignavibacteria bacterium]|nr:hypothetical protein [Ignavibacteria bacterium]